MDTLATLAAFLALIVATFLLILLCKNMASTNMLWGELKVKWDETRGRKEKILFVLVLFASYLSKRACMGLIGIFVVAGFSAVGSIGGKNWPAILSIVFPAIKEILIDFYNFIITLCGSITFLLLYLAKIFTRTQQ